MSVQKSKPEFLIQRLCLPITDPTEVGANHPIIIIIITENSPF
jgi:hypothetical protein